MSVQGRSVFMLALAALTLLMSCSWSASQQDVLDAFNETKGYVDRDEWEAVFNCVDSSTLSYLDSLAGDLSRMGLQVYGSGADLLPVLCRQYIDFSGDVTMIFVHGNIAEIASSSTRSNEFSLILEGDHWKLNLAEIFRNTIDAALTGSYIQ